MRTARDEQENWHPTMELRFIRREGKRILQQAWQRLFFHSSAHFGVPPTWEASGRPEHVEWRDVECIDGPRESADDQSPKTGV